MRDGEESKYVLVWIDRRGGGRDGKIEWQRGEVRGVGTDRLNGREEK